MPLRSARAAAAVKISVLTEMSGTYAEDSGTGSVTAARVDAIFDVPVSNCALAVATVARVHNKVAVFNTSTTGTCATDLVQTTPGEQAFRPLAQGGCALIPA